MKEQYSSVREYGLLERFGNELKCIDLSDKVEQKSSRGDIEVGLL